MGSDLIADLGFRIADLVKVALGDSLFDSAQCDIPL